MKKRIGLFLACMLCLGLFACDAQTDVDVITYEPETTQHMQPSEESMTQPTILPEIPEETQPQEPIEYIELVYSSAKTRRDNVGNIWMDVLVGFRNVSQEEICLSYSNIDVFADGEHLMTLTDAVCYPVSIEPGETGYYFEQVQADLNENAELTVQMQPNIERANHIVRYPVEDVQVRDSAFGVEIYGMYQSEEDPEGLLVAAVVLYDLDNEPIAVLSDIFSASTKEFILSSDKLPEGLSSQDISSYIAYVYPYEG